jgi:hypothetical protein
MKSFLKNMVIISEIILHLHLYLCTNVIKIGFLHDKIKCKYQ